MLFSILKSELRSCPPAFSRLCGTRGAPAPSEAVLTEEDLIHQSLADSNAGRYSSWLLTASYLLATHPPEPQEELQYLQWAHQQLQATGDARESEEGSTGTEFSMEMLLGSRAYPWANAMFLPLPAQGLRVEPDAFIYWTIHRPRWCRGKCSTSTSTDRLDKQATPTYFLEAHPEKQTISILS